MWYPESRDYPGAKQEFVLSWCKSKNWLEKWWCDCCSDEDIEEVKAYLTQCGMKNLDRDGDGVPCEALCN